MHSSAIYCANCGEIIGRHYEYTWGPRGCDPPEDQFFREDDVIFGPDDRAYCDRRCLEEAHPPEPEEDE